MAKITQGTAPCCSDDKWEREHAAREEHRKFTEDANSAFEKSSLMTRAGHGSDNQRLPPICPGPLRVGGFKKQA